MNENWKLRSVGQLEVQTEIKKYCSKVIDRDLERELKQMGPMFYELEISRGCQQWTVLKTKDEIMDFIDIYDENFHRWISFDDFFKKGLEILSNHKNIQSHQFFQRFFQIDYLEYRKFKSLKMLKKCGGRYIDKCLCQANWLLWKRRDFIITPDGVLYCHQKQKNLKEFISFGKSFRIKKFPEIPQPFGILLVSNHRKLLIQGQNIRNYFTFLYYLDKAQNSIYHNIRYDSFAPIRQVNNVEFYIDGENYFKELAKAIEEAKHELFICGWWISPEFQLIRPCNKENKKYRLDHLLQSVASRNVKIYILIYWESTFLTNCSDHTKTSLQKLHSNIKVIRHPDIILPSYWSHHQKMVIIDQHECFMGGLDICYGRFDNSQHSLAVNSVEMYPGVQYNNTRITDFKNVRNYTLSDISRDRPRLPWHDVALSLKGECVKDFCHHFIEYWNFASYQAHKLEREVLVSRSSRSIDSEVDFNPSKREKIKNFLRDHMDRVNNFFKEKFKGNNDNLNKATHNVIDTSKPFRESKKQLSENGQYELKRMDSSQELKPKKSVTMNLENQPIYRLTIPSNFEIKSDSSESKQSAKISKLCSEDSPEEFFDFSEKDNDGSFISELYEAGSITHLQQNQEGQTCQVLRSASHWSIGCKDSCLQKSISAAYIDTILSAQHFIYIENQFFISAVKGEEVIKNRIMEAVYERIARAIENNQNFKVYVILPLIPGFAGQLYDSSASIPKAIMNWQYRTICRHKNSLYSKLSKLTENPKEYIRFFGLRTHGVVGGKPITQIIYMHSKLLIADDNKMLMGSANINDRSMEGNRDSQLCLVVEKGEKVMKTINNQRMLVNKKIHQMRTKLWTQHFGLPECLCEDPFDDISNRCLLRNIERNTQIYRELFGCYPDDNVRKMKDLYPFIKRQIDSSAYQLLSLKIKGFAVDFPLNFLQEEDLSSLHPDIIST